MTKSWLTAALAVLSVSSTALGQSWPSSSAPHVPGARPYPVASHTPYANPHLPASHPAPTTTVYTPTAYPRGAAPYVAVPGGSPYVASPYPSGAVTTLPMTAAPTTTIPTYITPYTTAPFAATPYAAPQNAAQYAIPNTAIPNAAIPSNVRSQTASPYGLVQAGPVSRVTAPRTSLPATSPHISTPYATTPYATTPYAATPYAATPNAATPNAATPNTATPYATPHATAPYGSTANSGQPAAARGPASGQPLYRFATPRQNPSVHYAPVRMQRLANPGQTPPAVSPPAVKPPAVSPPAVNPPAVRPPAISRPPITPPTTPQPPVARPPVARPPVARPPMTTPPSVRPHVPTRPQSPVKPDPNLQRYPIHPHAHPHKPRQDQQHGADSGEQSRLVAPTSPIENSSVDPFALESCHNSPYSFPGQPDVICDAADTEYLEAIASARNGFFIQYDVLLWSITPPDTRVIGDPGSEGDFVVDGVSAHRVNSLDTGFVDYDTDSGHRIEFGHNYDERGWSMSIMFGRNAQSQTYNGVSFIPQDTSTLINERLLSGWADGNGDNIDDDLDGDNIHGNDGRDRGTPDGMGGYIAPFDGIPDEPAPQDNDDLVVYLPVFNQFTARREVEFRGVEWMGSYRYGLHQSSHFELLAGIRFLELDDTFAFSGSGGILDATSVSTSVRNQIFGPQLGVRWVGCHGPAWLSAEARFMAGLNYQQARQNGSIATNFTGGASQPAALTPFSFNTTRRNEEFAPIGEWRIESGYAINKYTRLKIGYTGMVIDGYSAALPKVQYRLPDFGMSTAGRRETVFITALTLGFEINR